MPKKSIDLPHHIAIICDGNRRWARRHGWEVFRGHQHAVDHTFDPIIDHAKELDIKVLTFWVFSTENWDRPQIEIDHLMNLFRKIFDQKIEKLHQNNIKVKAIGDTTRLAKDIQQKIIKAEELTAQNTGMTLLIAINYGGRDEIIRAIKKIAKSAKNDGDLADQLANLDEKTFAGFLDTAGLPDPDLIIRTSGEQRLSGFMAWQQQYAEFYFPSVTFPEFTPAELDKAIAEFAKRHRRFGSGEVRA